MDRTLFLLRTSLFPAVFVCLFFVSSAFPQKLTKENFVPSEILVKFSPEVSSERIAAAKRTIGGETIEEFPSIGWQRITLPAGMSVKDAIARYRELDGVEIAQPNFYYRLQATPNDAQFTNPGLYGLTKIAAPTAWDLTTGSSAVVVANIDTGMRMTHEDLAGNIWVNPGEIAGNGVDDDANGFVDDVNGWDFFFNDSNPTDEHGHGTHTGGTIGAHGNNLLGIAGVNWTVKIMPIKIYNNTGNGSTSSMLINAYNYIRMMKLRGVNIRVTNNSYGGCDEACGYDQATKDAIDAMGDVGILNVFAAGNSSVNTDITPFYPASYTSTTILSVGGSDENDNRRFNYGAVTVDLAAPGQGIFSTTFGSNSSYGSMSGTSMATPHAAGAAALLSAFNPNLSVASLKATLMNNVDLLPSFTGFNKSGGRLNVDKALRNQTVCTFSPTALTVNVTTKGGLVTLPVTTAPNCEFTVKSQASWIKVLDTDTFSGSSTVTFRVGVNSTITRNGIVVIGNQPISIRQSRVG